jgi:adenylate kinase family enzyme
MRLVLLGAPGSGKSTQSVVLAEHFGVPAPASSTSHILIATRPVRNFRDVDRVS